MGTENSKFDTASVEGNLNQLLRRLDQRNENCDKYVIVQIKNALITYSYQLSKLKTKKFSLNILIERAINKLDQIPVRQDINRDYNIEAKFSNWQKQLEKIDAYRKEIQKKLKLNQMSLNERDQHLKILTQYSLQLDNINKRKDEKLYEIKKNISFLFLELFIFDKPLNNHNITEDMTNSLINDKKTLNNIITDLRNLHILKHKDAEKSENNILDIFDSLERSAKSIQINVAEVLNRIDKMRKQILNEDFKQPSYQKQQKEAFKSSTEKIYQIDPSNSNRTVQIDSHEKAASTYRNSKMEPLATRRSNFSNKVPKKMKKNEEINNNPVMNKNSEVKMAKASFEESSTSLFKSFQERRANNKVKTQTKHNFLDDDVNNEDFTNDDAKEIELTVHKLTEEIQEFNYASSSHAYKQKMDEIAYLEKRLKHMQGSVIFNNILELRKVIEKKANQKNKETEYLKNLDLIEKNLYEKTKQLDLPKRFNELEKYKTYLKSLETVNNELTKRKINILDKIQTVESKLQEEKSKHDLWNVKSNYENFHKSFVSNLDVNNYTNRRKVLISALEVMKNMPKYDDNLEYMKLDLTNKYRELLETLDKKANKKEETDKCLQNLHNIEEEIALIKKSSSASQIKKKQLEQCKNKIINIKNQDKDVSNKKVEVLQNLEKSETKFSLSESQRNNMWKIKSSLDKYKNEVSQFGYPISSKLYKRKLQEISALREDLEKVSTENKNNEEEKRKISLEIDAVLAIFSYKAQENEDINNTLEDIDALENKVKDILKTPSSTKIADLKKCRMILNSIKNPNPEILERKNELLNIVNMHIDKEPVQSDKNSTSSNAQESNNIVDMQQYFDDFNLKNISAPVKSLEFIRTIKEMAESFESQIQNYKGTNYSTQYFVIDEKLMRLTEELDKIKSPNEEMLQEKIKAINYIKSLQKLLDQNATED